MKYGEVRKVFYMRRKRILPTMRKAQMAVASKIVQVRRPWLPELGHLIWRAVLSAAVQAEIMEDLMTTPSNDFR